MTFAENPPKWRIDGWAAAGTAGACAAAHFCRETEHE